jgi:hypothetical protein
MRARGPRGSVVARLGLTRQVALLSLLPIVALGFILAHAAGAGEPIAAKAFRWWRGLTPQWPRS